MPIFPTETTQLIATERNITCYGTLLDAYEVFPFDWFSFNIGIASVDGGGLAKGESAGETTIQSSWYVTTWQYQPVFDSCASSLQQVFANALCNVLAPEVTFLTAKLLTTNKTAQFVTNQATLDIETTTGVNACGGERFEVEATFRLPDGSAHCCINDFTNYVRLGSDNKFEFAPRLTDPDNTEYDFFGNGNPPKVVMYLRRRPDRGGSRSGITINVSGTYQDGTAYSSGATLTLRCP